MHWHRAEPPWLVSAPASYDVGCTVPASPCRALSLLVRGGGGGSFAARDSLTYRPLCDRVRAISRRGCAQSATIRGDAGRQRTQRPPSTRVESPFPGGLLRRRAEPPGPCGVAPGWVRAVRDWRGRALAGGCAAAPVNGCARVLVHCVQLDQLGCTLCGGRSGLCVSLRWPLRVCHFAVAVLCFALFASACSATVPLPLVACLPRRLFADEAVRDLRGRTLSAVGRAP